MKTITRNFFSLLLITVCTQALLSQTETTNKCLKRSGGIGHLNFSAEQLNIGSLNSALSANNYGTLNPYTSSFGGGGLFSVNNMLFGGGGAWLMNTSTANSFNSVNLKGGYGCFNIGYLFSAGKRSLFYPTLGIGGGGYTIFVGQKNASSADFEQQLNTPNGMISIEAGGWMTTFQLNYQYFFSRSTEGFFIGLSAGYKYSPYAWSSAMNNSKLSNAPEINMNGFFVRLCLGGGSILE
jgi:hypothetical protein